MKKHFLSLVILLLFIANSSFANNMLIQNVTTTGNNPTNKTIQVQFDMSWDNSWRDSINWDAAWLFIKYKDANGLWQHAQLSLSGYANGNGTANIVKVTSDKVGAWVYRSALGSGTFNSTSMQLQWNYGLNGLANATGLEVRVFAVEMVYVPEGDFVCANNFDFPGGRNSGSIGAPGGNFPVINQKMTPLINYYDGTAASLRIKGDIGLDTNNDGLIDVNNYPTGYKAFYAFKYELTEQQYADFLNTLTSTQINNLGLAGSGIYLNYDKYFTYTPNLSCGNSNPQRLLAYADWAGLRPISFLEFNKASYGPLLPVWVPDNGGFGYNAGYPAWGSNYNTTGYNSGLHNVGYLANSNSTRITAGSSYYGIMDLTFNGIEPVVKLNSYFFTIKNGNGFLSNDGKSDEPTWLEQMVIYIDQFDRNFRDCYGGCSGFRYVRSAE